jgi:tRNA dihydrouridine synthase A
VFVQNIFPTLSLISEGKGFILESLLRAQPGHTKEDKPWQLCAPVSVPRKLEMSSLASPAHRLSIAPMMDFTDKHFRFMMRLLTKEAQLYTEMLVDQTLWYQRDHLEWFLATSKCESPVAVQLGGSDPESMAQAAALCSQYGGFNEININCGCPSSKCAKGGAEGRCFGARLMLDPGKVAAVCKAIKKVTQLPVTVKCRIGADTESWEELRNFIHTVAQTGVKHFIIHARKCILGGLSPAQNRQVPPLRYERVYQLMQEFPDLVFSINGGIKTFDEIESHLNGTWRQHPELTAAVEEGEEQCHCEAAFLAGGKSGSSTGDGSSNIGDDSSNIGDGSSNTGDGSSEVGSENLATVFSGGDGGGGNSGSRNGNTGHEHEEHGHQPPAKKVKLTVKMDAPPGMGSRAAAAVAAAAAAAPPPESADVRGPLVTTTGRGVYGVMVGRLAYQDTWKLRHVDSKVFGKEDQGFSRREVIDRYLTYAEGEQQRWGVTKVKGSSQYCAPSRALVKPLLGLFTGEPRCKQLKNKLVQACYKEAGNIRGLVEGVLAEGLLPDTSLDAR